MPAKKKKQLSRVDVLERALGLFCYFHVAVSRALDDGDGNGGCVLEDWIVSLGAEADRSLRGVAPIKPRNLSLRHWRELGRQRPVGGR